jgi:hypothetical protein
VLQVGPTPIRSCWAGSTPATSTIEVHVNVSDGDILRRNIDEDGPLIVDGSKVSSGMTGEFIDGDRRNGVPVRFTDRRETGWHSSARKSSREHISRRHSLARFHRAGPTPTKDLLEWVQSCCFDQSGHALTERLRLARALRVGPTISEILSPSRKVRTTMAGPADLHRMTFRGVSTTKRLQGRDRRVIWDANFTFASQNTGHTLIG